MDPVTDEKIDSAVFRAGGIALIVLALFSIPKLLGALLSIVLVWRGTRILPMDEMTATMMTHHFFSGLLHILNFVILLFLAKWMFREPQILKKWMQAHRKQP